jgi:signal transduction histidine kinase/ligand-binding sensor domain-containing protein/CheY-like chemotaxis protein
MAVLLPLLLGLLQQPVLPQDLVLEASSTMIPATVERWGLKEGLPQAQVNVIAADSLGQLWIGTHGGLAIFDGQELRAYSGQDETKLASLRITALCVDQQDVVWIGTESDGLGRLINGRYESVELNLPSGRNFVKVMEVREADDGSLWVAHANGVAQLSAQGELLQSFDQIGRAFATAAGADGSVWIAGDGLRRLKRQTIELVYSESVDCVHVDRLGRVWAGDHHTRLLKIELDGSQQRFISRTDNGGIRAIAEADDGTIWFGGWNPFAFRNGEFFSTKWEEDPSLALRLKSRALLIDREGTLWTGGGGLSALRERALSPLLHEEFRDDTPRIAMEDQHYPGSTWIGMYSGALRLLKRDGESSRHSARAESMAAGADGYTYALSPLNGLIRLHPDRFDTLVPPEALPPGPTLALLQDAYGNWWGSCGSRLVQFPTNGLAPRVWGNPDGLDLGIIHKLALDARGDLWVGARGGIAVVGATGAVTKVLSTTRELAMGEVREIHFRNNGLTWLGHYGGGISLLDANGKARVLTVAHGLHENVVHRILAEADGSLILLGNRGISWLSAADVAGLENDPSYRASPRVFDQLPGVAEFEGMGGAMPAGGYTANGDVVLPALLAAARFSTASARPRLPAPNLKFVRIESNKADLAESEAQFIPPDDRGLLVQYRAITFVDPHLVRYQYILEGRESDWVDAGNRELAHYESLPPGRYRFLVRAANRDGVWSEVLSTQSLHFRAAWFERTWVWVLVLAASGVLTIHLLRRSFARQRLKRDDLERTVASRTAALATARDRLETEVEMRTEDLRQALSSLRADMAKREELEAKLRQSERLESVGRLAGGIAHDFNNILTAILGEADLGEAATSDEKLRARFLRIRDAGEHAARLTEQMLAFSREQPSRPRAVRIDAAIRDTSGLLQQLLPNDIEFSLDLQADGACAQIDPSQLEQVIMNLVLNARDALGKDGRIEVATRVLARQAELASSTKGGQDGVDQIELRVRDNGCGIAEGVRPHIFDPFFTTKDPGKGTGLGLASVHGIVQQAGGTIEVSSSSKDGSEFRIRLPLCGYQHGAETKEDAAPRARTTVMLCDDEPAVLQVMTRALEGEAWELLAASSPAQALAVARDRPGAIDLLVTDVVMSGMTGVELARAWKLARPKTRVAFVSGYSRGGLHASGEQEIEGAFLAKPFRPESFRSFVRDQLKDVPEPTNLSSQ